MKYPSPDETRRIIGQRIRARRESLGISLSLMAAKIIMALPQLRLLEQGQSNVTINKLIEVCRVLDCRLSDLMD